MSLVVVAATAGLAQTQQQANPTGSSVDANFFVSAARGANDVQVPPSSSEALSILPEEELVLADRGAPATIPAHAGPMPTPVPIDPDATPLPPPTTGVGQAAVQTSPSTRSATPAPPSGGLVWPVPGGAISQYFHAGHLALDIAAPYGSQIVAVQGGTVTWAGWRNNGGGYVVAIEHGNGMRTTYNHLGGIWVSPGQYVGAGQGIGSVGCSGICTGPHVHFEVVTNGIIDNPLRYF